MLLKFRPLTSSDFPSLLEWLSKEHVKEWWDDGDDTLAKVARHYSEEEAGLGRFILVVSEGDGEKPIGYFQHYRTPDAFIGIDQFIGEEDYINRGVGTQAVRLFVEMLIRTHNPRAIVLDPAPENKRAIRCYEKAGFRHCETTQQAEGGSAYLMRLECGAGVGQQILRADREQACLLSRPA